MSVLSAVRAKLKCFERIENECDAEDGMNVSNHRLAKLKNENKAHEALLHATESSRGEKILNINKFKFAIFKHLQTCGANAFVNSCCLCFYRIQVRDRVRARERKSKS